MIEIERPNITTVELKSDGSYGKFVIEPLERGYGTTLGNSLRRVLLSSLPGVAATSVKIDGVLHEISVIPNVKEDVPEIILNIKGITAKLHTDAPKTVILEATEEGEVTLEDGLLLVDRLRGEGLSLRDAVRQAAKELGLPRKQLYDRAVDR